MSFFKNIFNSIIRFFQHETIKRTTKKVTRVTSKKPLFNDKRDFVTCLVTPHTIKRQGADDYNGESEYIKNERIIKKVINKLNMVQLDGVNLIQHQLYRNANKGYSSQCREVTKEAKRLDADLVMSLHFNSGGGVGLEILVAQKYTSTTDLEWIVGKFLANSMKFNRGFTLRRDGGMFKISKSHNGSGMALAVERAGIPFLLVEPAFLDSINAQSKFIVENENSYVDELVGAILAGAKYTRE